MSTIFDYEKFLVWLHAQPGVADDVKRVANVVHANFSKIEPTSSNQGQRGRILAPLLKANLGRTEPVLHAISAAHATEAAQWVRLKQLVVGPFRGFRTSETFDLGKRIVLVYGPNGTGKTSLCEALEYGLLGEVEEAGVKRIAANDYLKNVHARRFVAPVLHGSDATGQDIAITPSLDAYRFCFVEKNRIEAFSRMASRTPAQRTELIAALFGMQKFSEFVRNFNADLDQHLPLLEVKGQELARKRQILLADQNAVKTEAAQRAALVAQEAALAEEYQHGLTYDGLVALVGSDERPGRLHELDHILAAVTPAEFGVSVQGLRKARVAASTAQEQLAVLSAQLEQRRAEVNFKALYEALQGLEQDGFEYCPACTTPLRGDKAVLQNPFQRARSGLAELAQLATLQRQHADAAATTRQATQTLKALLLRVSSVPLTEGLNVPRLSGAIRAVGEEPVGPWWQSLDQASGDTDTEGRPITFWRIAEELCRRAEQADQATRQLLSDREKQVAERNRLRSFALRVNQQAVFQTQLTSTVADAKARIEAFETTNRDLIVQADAERPVIEAHRRISAGYRNFLDCLRRYRDQLPQALTADLSETARDLYNGFNRYDHASDQLAQLSLPTNEAGRILIAFNSHPDDLHDALHVMSEGHIRCLGLAILMAKNIKQNCPVLIFDDAVNAIDDEHRLGIRDTFFDNTLLENKQLLITCHGEELIKDIENVIGHRGAQQDCLSYTFLPHQGDRVIRVVPGETRNYVLEARTTFNAGRIRDSLGAARRATEAVTARTWQFMARVGHGELRLKMERVRAPHELHDLATQLKKKIDAPAFVHERKARLAAGYEFMLESRSWAVLNPGTHEEAGRADFPRETVRQVIENLAVLDDVLSGR